MSKRITDGLDISDREQVSARAQLLADMIAIANAEFDKGNITQLVIVTKRNYDNQTFSTVDHGDALEFAVGSDTNPAVAYYNNLDASVYDKGVALVWKTNSTPVVALRFSLSTNFKFVPYFDCAWVYTNDGSNPLLIEDWYYDVWQPSQIEEDWSEVWEDD